MVTVVATDAKGNSIYGNTVYNKVDKTYSMASDTYGRSSDGTWGEVGSATPSAVAQDVLDALNDKVHNGANKAVSIGSISYSWSEDGTRLMVTVVATDAKGNSIYGNTVYNKVDKTYSMASDTYGRSSDGTWGEVGSATPSAVAQDVLDALNDKVHNGANKAVSIGSIFV